MAAEPTPEEAARERKRLGIPTDPDARRVWIQQQLLAQGWTQAGIARATNVSDTSVSHIFTGRRTVGEKADRVRQMTAELLDLPEAVLFPEAAAERARAAEIERQRLAEDQRYRKAEWYRRPGKRGK